jgi:hypothetical protein
MAGITWKFETGEAVSSATVNANFSDLATLSSNIAPKSFMDGNVCANHLKSNIAVPPAVIERLRLTDEVVASLPSLPQGGAPAGIVPLVGRNAPIGARNHSFNIIEKDDIVLVSAYVDVVLNNPYNAVGVRPSALSDVGKFSVKKGLTADPPQDLVGAGGVDACSRTWSYIDLWGYTGGAGVGPTGFGLNVDDSPMFTLRLNWMFQDDFSGLDPNQLTLYHEGLSFAAIPEIQFVRAGLHILVIKR